MIKDRRSMKMDHFFKVRLLWETIEKIFHMKDIQVKGLSYIPRRNVIYLGKDNKLHLCFKKKCNEDIFKDLGRVLPEIEILTGDNSFIIPYGYAVYDDIGEVSFDRVRNLTIKINRLDYGKVDDKSKYFWRYVYPINFYSWFLQIDSLNYNDDNGTHVNFSYLKPVVGSSDMHIFVTRQEHNHYMVIQSENKIDSEEMYKRVFSITTALGLILGVRFGDFRFQIASDDRDFGSISSMIFGTLEEAKNYSYRIVNNNWRNAYNRMQRFDYQKYARDILVKSISNPSSDYDDKPLGANVFENLVNLCYGNNNIAISTSMIQEGSLLKMMYQPPFFHVALESITSALTSDNQEKKNSPLGNDEYKKTVKPVLLEALNSIEELSADARKIYSNRINSSLNSPPNQDKLEKPFEKYGYNLTKADTKAIERRNYIFHGSLSDIKQELPCHRWDMFAVVLKLHKLCCILLLKAAGYTGRIWNNEVVFGIKEACERKDPPYIEI